MNLFSKIFHSGIKEDTKDASRILAINEVVDQLAYKFSIPQGKIRYIIWRWMQFEKEFMKHD